MEEKKEKKMTPQLDNLSYEELKLAASQMMDGGRKLYEENESLKKAIKAMQMNNFYTELGYRFKVLELRDRFPETFVDRIREEIIDMMTIKEEKEETEQQEKKDAGQ